MVFMRSDWWSALMLQKMKMSGMAGRSNADEGEADDCLLLCLQRDGIAMLTRT